MASGIEITRDNHFVPQALLRRWSQDGHRIYVYKALVPDERVPTWELRSIKTVAKWRDLYTGFKDGIEVDEFERWIMREYEVPGLAAIDQLINRNRLTPLDWRAMVRFVAAQDVRTPTNYVESMRRWDKTLPRLLEETLEKAVKNGKNGAIPPHSVFDGTQHNPLKDFVRVRVEKRADPQSQGNEVEIRAEMSVGRELWIGSMRTLLTGVISVLCEHRWSVVAPGGAEQWPISDHPVLKLNYYKPGHYDFRGGWGNPGTEIMMPVSPRHLLYARVGEKAPSRFEFSKGETRFMQQLLVERAARSVFASRPEPWVAAVRPRMVDRELFEDEREAWNGWRQDQSQSERR